MDSPEAPGLEALRQGVRQRIRTILERITTPCFLASAREDPSTVVQTSPPGAGDCPT